MHKSLFINHTNTHQKFAFLVILLLLLALVSLCVGSINISISESIDALCGNGSDEMHFIMIELRFPQMITAILAGSALAVSGLLMQTLFENPLADPSLLGINSGASLGVAIALLVLGGSWTMGDNTLSGIVLTIVAAFVGASIVNVLLVVCSRLLHGNLALLIAGVMVSFVISAIISLLSFYASADGVRSFVVWGLGDFSEVSLQRLPLMIVLTMLPMLMLLWLATPLNAMLLGMDYATNLGINVRRVRTLSLLITGGLTATVTALCGPISFIGLAVPHIARMFFSTSNHRQLLPACVLIGANVALLSLIISHLPGERGILPLAAITPLMGVPIVFYILFKSKQLYI